MNTTRHQPHYMPPKVTWFVILTGAAFWLTLGWAFA